MTRKQSETGLNLTPATTPHSQQKPPNLTHSGSEHHLRIEPQINKQGGITGLGLAEFSDNDRFAAIVKFLANPEVFRKVFSKELLLIFAE
jgi:hypothetical protein